MGFSRACLVLAVTLLAWNTWDFAPDVTPPAQRLAQMGVNERRVALQEMVRNKSHSDIFQWLAETNDSVSYQLTMEMCPPKLALQVYEEMCQQGLSDLDGTALAGAMRACAALEDVEMLAKLIPKLKEPSRVNSKAFRYALDGAGSTGDVVMAARIMDLMASSRVSCSQTHFAKAIEAAARKEPPSPGSANYFLQEIFRRAMIPSDKCVKYVMSAHRNMPLSLNMSVMRSMILGKKLPISSQSAEVFLSSVLRQMPHELDREKLDVLSLSKAQVSSLQKLLEDFAARGVRLPVRSAWINDLPEMLRASSKASQEDAKTEGP